MSDISFYAGETAQIFNLNGSGIGLYGASFGQSVPVGGWNSSTFVTDSNGTIQGIQADNISYAGHPNSGTANGAGPYDLTHIPNQLATLNIRFTNDSAVTTQNGEVRIYDRSNINNNPSGVTCLLCELIHIDPVVGAGGSGDASWSSTMGGSGVTLPIVDSPATSGFSPLGSNSSDTQHDWYLAITASPDSIGSKTQFGLYVAIEYL